METVRALRFSSGYSVETFQLLDLLSKALPTETQPYADHVILQQYQAQSPHFHDKRDDDHIKRMIADSLGSFFYFQDRLTPLIKQQLQHVYHELDLEMLQPIVYPALQDLSLETSNLRVSNYLLLEEYALPIEEQEAMCG
jgi:mannosyl-3-phosphoglycerate synthase